MKLRAQKEGLAVIAIIAAVLAKDTLVAITGNRTVDKAGANAAPLGRLVVPAKNAGEQGTVETKFKEFLEIKAAAALAAGDYVKLGAPDNTTGENTAAVWTDGTDSVKRIYGVVWNGAAAGGTAEVLTF